MASVHRYETDTGKVRWRAMAWVGPRQRSRSFLTERAAKEFAAVVNEHDWEHAERIRALKLGSSLVGRIPSVAQALDDHIDNLSDVLDGTQRRYRRIAQRIADSRLGALPVDGVTRDDVNRWVRELSGTLSGKTITNWHGLLHGALERQVELGNIRSNPARKTKIRRTVKRAKVRLTPDEFAILFEHMRDWYKPLTALLFNRGLRFSEATALQVRDFDLDSPRPTMWVGRAWKWTGDSHPQLGPPKIEKGERSILLPAELVQTLRPLIEGKQPREFVFTTPTGRPVSNSDYRRAWLKALRDANLAKHPRIHDLRHSYAMNQLSRGTPLPVVQIVMGHESIRTTVDTYGGISQDALMIEAQVASETISSAIPEVLPELEA